MQEADPTQAKAAIGAGAVLIDVRTDDEWNAGHAPEARHLELATLPDVVGALPKDQDYFVVCKMGGRSAQATDFLASLEYNATNVVGGMAAWQQAGLVVVDSSGADGTIL